MFLIAALLFLLAGQAKAETARTCSNSTNSYGGGEVCGETTANQTVQQYAETGDGDNQGLMVLASIAMAAIVTTTLYKLTFRSYILG